MGAGWQDYDPNVCKIIESAFIRREKTVKIDEQRYIDFDKGIQARFDDAKRQRYIRRHGPSIITSTQKNSNASHSDAEKKQQDKIKQQQQQQMEEKEQQKANQQKQQQYDDDTEEENSDSEMGYVVIFWFL